MTAALGHLLARIIDYAGLFPPASLELNQAVDHYAADRDGNYRAVLRHFIVPAQRLSELDQLISSKAPNRPWTLSVLVGGGATSAEWIQRLDVDFAAIESHCIKNNSADLKVLEIALPSALAADTHSFVQTIEEINSRTENANLADVDLFFETISADHRRALVDALGPYQQTPSHRGLKLRTGGMEAQHFPSGAALADVIELCESSNIPWKATAGLHHPLPYACPDIGVTMHGFLNLLLGVVLWGAKKVTSSQLRELVTDANADHFVFSDDHVGWQGACADQMEILSGRDRFLSFGSCSFSEPIEDLETLGLLPNRSIS